LEKICTFDGNILRYQLEIEKRWNEEFKDKEPTEQDIKNFAAKYWGSKGPDISGMGILAFIPGPWHLSVGST